jgi:hypothetical protein
VGVEGNIRQIYRSALLVYDVHFSLKTLLGDKNVTVVADIVKISAPKTASNM